MNPDDLSWEPLQKLGALTVHNRTQEDQVLERARHAEVILTNKVPVRKSAMEKLPDLKYIGVTATGFNIIDTEYARSRGITVTNVPGYSTASVAQLTFALLLESCLHVQRHSDRVREGAWTEAPDFCFWDYPLIELAGKTMGVIGLGSIGRKVADIASAFGMHVLAYSRTRSDQSHRQNFAWTDLNDLLSRSDVISLHCPLTAQTQALINKESIALMKPGAFLINTSRGGLINEYDLADALNSGRIAGAGLDVLSTEPPPSDNPLLSAKNCLITPHFGWASTEARIRLMKTTISNLEAFINGHTVNQVG